ncbi:type II CRISPR RNA-guided endonuclease Cas9 [Eggerthella sp. YY7918]|uniref:type II CRISPR RNA-guided endonuclease Cas9 n=1 Tax=Eggerthella sp. (strain YY7918) TaxID=502558 RepID=UPI0002171745|nr:type II CRISPR RNA-guided endonuclease Cas9 [Eggerthella sp. YY7918]BAK45586.1 hypothetical protein EGYY_25780 [Eggerthella sp. YY7918]
MNLRHVGNYNIGLDMGTASVGWAAIDEQGELLHFKGKPTWGSRLFDSANTAATARMPRGQRRRYIRRRWRLDLLQKFFSEEMAEKDPEFFIRLRQSSLWPEDREGGHTAYHWPLFNDSDFNEKEYYEKFPTIFHLRQWLMETDEKADIRLIYLAFHNIVKHRGNFLQENNDSLSAQNANMRESLESFCIALEEWCDEKELTCSCDPQKLEHLFKEVKYRSDIRDGFAALLGLACSGENEVDVKAMAKEMGKAIVGYKADFSKIFTECDKEGSSFRLSDDEGPEAFLDICPDDGIALFEAIQMVYSSFILTGMLTEKGLSLSKISAYNQYGQDLESLKALVKEYVPNEYSSFFRGPTYSGSTEYDPSKAQGYTRYNLGPSKKGSGAKPMAYEDFKKSVEQLFANTNAINDERYKEMMGRFAEEKFLRRLRTSDNGRIPFQLNLEEMTAIIINQGKYYPFLLEQQEKLESLVRFRIPYYVGPLTRINARLDSKGNACFAWSKRKDGMDSASIKPWNWDEVIDKHASAQAFIERMTGTCTYLRGEPVLPRCSLLYEEYCVLNELNGARWTQDGDKFIRFDYKDRSDIIEELFKKRRGRIQYAAVADWMKQERSHANVHVSGGQGENAFESRLSSYHFFCNDVFGVDELPGSYVDMVEEIILWSTLFEDRSILREEIQRKYGDVLNEEQIKTICKKRFSGWGRLSRKLLCSLKAQTDNGPKSIMDILQEGDQNNGRVGRAMVFQEILHDEQLGFEQKIEEENTQSMLEGENLLIEDLPGSPAIRRSINQAVRIVDEIVGIAGHAPDNIFIEVTREDDTKKKGKRTTTRYSNIQKALEALKEEGAEALRELKTYKHNELDKRLSLYFMQNGKSLYSGIPLDIRRLSEYQIDHIIPQSYIKDDSYENMALVLPGENQSKADNLLISQDIRIKMKATWTALHKAGLMGDKKYNNLMNSSISDAKMKGFINRQLVETSQSVKLTQMMLSQKYPGAKVRPIKASISSQLRDACDLVKCREANDYHHAHDAYLACQVGRFVLKRHSSMFDNPIGMTKVIRDFVKRQGQEFKRNGKLPAYASRSGFIVQSFMRSGFDAETGELLRDDWNAPFEIARIKRCLNYRDCYISRMPMEDSGAFWDATIYSPKAGKKGALPVKQGLPVEKYGSYSREQFAYFFVYKAYNPKKKAYRLEFEAVPVRVASAVETRENALEEYAKSVAKQAGLEFVEVARPKVYKYQLIELGEDRLYITGKREVRNASQLAFSLDEIDLLKRLAEGEETSSEERERLFDVLIEKYARYAPRLARQLSVDSMSATFETLNAEEQLGILLSLVEIANGKRNMIDLSSAGGSKNAGCMNPTFSSELSSPGSNFTFIDQSVTGMFERRQRLEL